MRHLLTRYFISEIPRLVVLSRPCKEADEPSVVDCLVPGFNSGPCIVFPIHREPVPVV